MRTGSRRRAGIRGAYGPYRQSERKDIYAGYARQLVASGWAYTSFDTPAELDAYRAEAEAAGRTFSYGPATRMGLRNSLSLPASEVQRLTGAGEPYAIRFKMPEDLDVTEEDLIRGSVTFNTRELDDKVLFKSDGMPTYHLANVVDDHLMEISHVIRGEEWLPSLPLHILLYRAFGWEETRPRFSHLPLILKPQGKGKLSKRDGDKMGFPVFPLLWKDPETGEHYRGYREDGYFPEAFLNLLALLGWNPGTDQEIFTLAEMATSFSLERVVKSGSRFDPEKARWFNRQYLQKKAHRSWPAWWSPSFMPKISPSPWPPWWPWWKRSRKDVTLLVTSGNRAAISLKPLQNMMIRRSLNAGNQVFPRQWKKSPDSSAKPRCGRLLP